MGLGAVDHRREIQRDAVAVVVHGLLNLGIELGALSLVGGTARLGQQLLDLFVVIPSEEGLRPRIVVGLDRSEFVGIVDVARNVADIGLVFALGRHCPGGADIELDDLALDPGRLPTLLKDGCDLARRGIAGIDHELDRGPVITRLLHQFLGLCDVKWNLRYAFRMVIHFRHVGVGHFAEAVINRLEDSLAIGCIIEGQPEILAVERLLLVVQIDIVETENGRRLDHQIAVALERRGLVEGDRRNRVVVAIAQAQDTRIAFGNITQFNPVQVGQRLAVGTHVPIMRIGLEHHG